MDLTTEKPAHPRAPRTTSMQRTPETLVTAFSPSEAAVKLGVKPSTIRSWIACGAIRAKQVGHLWFIAEAEVMRLVNEINGVAQTEGDGAA